MPVFLRWLLRLGPANPIAVRLVQNASRRTKHLYVRSAYLAVLILVLLWAMLANSPGTNVSYRELASAGATSFALIAYLQVGLICVIAPVFMAGAIAQEANPKTWDIILTTPMSKLEIVLGNLFGRLFFVLALLFASLPLFALTQFFGGVPGKSIINAYIVSAGAASCTSKRCTDGSPSSVRRSGSASPDGRVPRVHQRSASTVTWDSGVCWLSSSAP